MDQASVNQLMLIMFLGTTSILLTFIVKRYEENKEIKVYERSIQQETQQKNFINKVENFKL